MKFKIRDIVKIKQEWRDNIPKYETDYSGKVGRLVGLRGFRKDEGELIFAGKPYHYRVKIPEIVVSISVYKIEKATEKEIKEFLIDDL